MYAPGFFIQRKSCSLKSKLKTNLRLDNWTNNRLDNEHFEGFEKPNETKPNEKKYVFEILTFGAFIERTIK
jgi:hypothetical protein